MSKAEKRRLRLAALGLILLGLWGMLALLLGASVGKEARYRAELKADLEPGFGVTRAAPHPLADTAGPSSDKDLLAFCVEKHCPGARDFADSALFDRPVDDGADDATSSIGRPHGPQNSPDPGFPDHGELPLSIVRGGTPDPFSAPLFIPGGLPSGKPNPDGPGNSNPADNPPDNPGTPHNPGDIPPLDIILPPFSDGPGKVPQGPGGPKGPTESEGPGGTPVEQPQQIPEPLTLSLFAAGLAGSVHLRRRKIHSTK